MSEVSANTQKWVIVHMAVRSWSNEIDEMEVAMDLDDSAVLIAMVGVFFWELVMDAAVNPRLCTPSI